MRLNAVQLFRHQNANIHNSRQAGTTKRNVQQKRLKKKKKNQHKHNAVTENYNSDDDCDYNSLSIMHTEINLLEFVMIGQK